MTHENFDLETEIANIINGIHLVKNMGQNDTFFELNDIESNHIKQIIENLKINGYRVTTEGYKKINVFWD